MKRTKDGGAIVDGKKIDKETFYRRRTMRDLLRLGIVIFAGLVDLIIPVNGEFGILTLGVFLIMIGWRMKAGW